MSDAVIESVDEHVVRVLRGWSAGPAPTAGPEPVGSTREELLAYFDAQLRSRHLDFAARWLQEQGEGFYTIGSAGHEANAAVAMALRPTDPALLHYRSGGFYAARAAQVPGSDAIGDILHGIAASTLDPISGGRHKVFGHAGLAVIPQTSTIGSHLPRAVGLAFGLGRRPAGELAVCSFGDASVNHSTTQGALNAASYCAHQGVPLPLLLVCEDNGIGISTRSPAGWIARRLAAQPAIEYVEADGADPVRLLATTRALAERVRAGRAPAILHLRTVRLMGHAGSDLELGYRSRRDILADYARDPLLATASVLVASGALTPEDALDRYEAVRAEVMGRAKELVGTVSRLESGDSVTAPIVARRPEVVAQAALRVSDDRAAAFGGTLPEDAPPLTLAQSINAALRDVLAARPDALLFGEDVAAKGGVYGVTRGLRKTFGAARVFDTLLDEQTILGTALGTALLGQLPIPEIQYLAYLHNAEDQLRGEAATLGFFSDGRYRNPMVVRIAGLGYQRGFGGHFHNDNSVAVLRDIPGLVVAVPSHPSTAPGLLRQCVALAEAEGRVCVYLEPIALYHRRDLSAGDGRWLARYGAPWRWGNPVTDLGRTWTARAGTDVLVVTFGNGVPMSLRAAERLAAGGIGCGVLDLQWLAPLPVDDLLAAAGQFDRVLVADETRHSGGVAEAVLAALVDAGHPGRLARVNSADSFVPLGPAAEQVLLAEDDIVAAVERLMS